MIEISLIGTGGMMPLAKRHLTAMAARLNGSMLLIDCGEGTQISLKSLGWGFKNLDIICLTHFHADHVSGLPGLLLTVGNSGRTEPMAVIGPPGTQKVVNALRVIAPELPFKIEFIEPDVKKGEIKTVTRGDYVISITALAHKMTCYGYSLHLERAGKFNPDRAKNLNIPIRFWSRLQKGERICESDGRIFTPEMVMGSPRKGIKISYVTDTRPVKNIVDFVKKADLFICEGMYGDEEKKENVIEHKHMLFSEAAGLAHAAEVEELWLTHFSPAMQNPENYLETAANIFENSYVGYDRKTVELRFVDE